MDGHRLPLFVHPGGGAQKQSESISRVVFEAIGNGNESFGQRDEIRAD